ncbi:VCBS repeat-containing protein [Seohaeicola saemankumensis]|nr:VCBS repeat-containing protein [Seohaeicola saemankumensis]MCA0872052.1 VCBS repeat-containing protein [Seohaeicola saemankumensis]
MHKAPRRPSRPWAGLARGALLASGLWLAAAGGTAADVSARVILGAAYTAPTTRYAHGVLGDAVEWGALELRIDSCPACAALRPETLTITLPDTRVFEDIAPRLADLDGDGAPEVIVVETDMTRGAALAVYGPGSKIAQTPHIGQSNRWLAPLGAADLDGDGYVELAYIDRPHLAKTLRVWRFADGALEPVADLPGLTNHRIGEDFISGGIRHCAPRPEIITADARWTRIIATTLEADRLQTRDLGPFAGRDSLTAALACR